MASLAEAGAQAKDGLADLLTSTDGLRPADDVTVASAPLEPLPSVNMVILGDVQTTTPGQPDLVGRSGAFTLNGWVIVTRPENGEQAIRDARSTAAAYMGAIEAAVKGDRTAAGTITPPGGTAVSSTGLTESQVDWQGQAARQAQIPFSITWTSHVT